MCGNFNLYRTIKKMSSKRIWTAGPLHLILIKQDKIHRQTNKASTFTSVTIVIIYSFNSTMYFKEIGHTDQNSYSSYAWHHRRIPTLDHFRFRRTTFVPTDWIGRGYPTVTWHERFIPSTRLCGKVDIPWNHDGKNCKHRFHLGLYALKNLTYILP